MGAQEEAVDAGHVGGERETPVLPPPYQPPPSPPPPPARDPLAAVVAEGGGAQATRHRGAAGDPLDVRLGEVKVKVKVKVKSIISFLSFCVPP